MHVLQVYLFNILVLVSYTCTQTHIHAHTHTRTHTQLFLDIVGDGEFLPHSKLIDWLSDQVCPVDRTVEGVCEDILFLSCGFDRENMNLVSG